jgi:copper chaperone
MKTILRSKDLSCPSCVAKIEKALKGLDGVSQARVHFTTGRIEVEHDPGKTNVSALIRAIGQVGYEAGESAF